MDRGWKQKEEGWQKKRSESLLRQTSSNDRENRPALTGYKPLKQEDLPSGRQSVWKIPGVFCLSAEMKKSE